MTAIAVLLKPPLSCLQGHRPCADGAVGYPLQAAAETLARAPGAICTCFYRCEGAGMCGMPSNTTMLSTKIKVQAHCLNVIADSGPAALDMPYNVAGQQDKVIIVQCWKNDPLSGALAGVEVQHQITADGARQAKAKYLVFGCKTYYPFIQVVAHAMWHIFSGTLLLLQCVTKTARQGACVLF